MKGYDVVSEEEEEIDPKEIEVIDPEVVEPEIEDWKIVDEEPTVKINHSEEKHALLEKLVKDVIKGQSSATPSNYNQVLIDKTLNEINNLNDDETTKVY